MMSETSKVEKLTSLSLRIGLIGAGVCALIYAVFNFVQAVKQDVFSDPFFILYFVALFFALMPFAILGFLGGWGGAVIVGKLFLKSRDNTTVWHGILAFLSIVAVVGMSTILIQRQYIKSIIATADRARTEELSTNFIVKYDGKLFDTIGPTSLAYLLVRNPNISPAALENIFNMDLDRVNLLVAENTNTPQYILVILAERENKMFNYKLRLAENPSTPPEVLAKIFEYHVALSKNEPPGYVYYEIRTAMASLQKNPSTPADLLQRIKQFSLEFK